MEEKKIYFNCTIQELKLGRYCIPIWNIKGFQLHHTGIKTVQYLFVRVNNLVFQLHHTGIKTLCGNVFWAYLCISIAPYRN